MRVLFVSHIYPWPPITGNPMRVFNLLRGMTARHRVTLVALNPMSAEDALDPLATMCERVVRVVPVARARGPAPASLMARSRLLRELHSLTASLLPGSFAGWECPELLEALERLNATEKFDVVWVERAYIAETVRRAGFFRFVVDLDDIESVARARALRHTRWHRWKPILYAELAKHYAYERLMPGRFARLVVCKEADRAFFGRGARRVDVVPNGVDALPAADPAAEQPGEILFTGQLDYPPNMDAVIRFYLRVMPELRKLHPGVRFAAVGHKAVPLVRAIHNGRDCVIASSVPDITPYYESASVVVVPIRLGSGTRIKVLEALARGKAVVSTSVGAEGIDVRPGVDLELADSPVELAHACARLLGDPARRRQLGASGRARVLELYQWDRIAEVAEHVLASAAAGA